MRSIARSSALLVLSLSSFAVGAFAQSNPVESRIANGLPTQQFPSTGYFLSQQGFGTSYCSGVLIGCQTFLTAAHCVCTDSNDNTLPGSECLSRPDLLTPAGKTVFLQNGGNYAVSSVSVDPDFVFGVKADFAILHLSTPVTGVAPSPIDTTGRVPAGSSGTIVGFGLTGGNAFDVGIKRTGKVVTVACPASLVPNSTHLCWTYAKPIGTPGLNSDTCAGDSGGPLFNDLGQGQVLTGITSGGDTNCVPTDHSFDADVYVHRAWIMSNAGSDLGTATCGNLPAAGTAGTTILTANGTLNVSNPRKHLAITVPEGTDRLRVTLNNTGDSDFDLYVRQGGTATATQFTCKSEDPVLPDTCEIISPIAGAWDALALRADGDGDYQLTATLFPVAKVPPTPCVPSDTVMCLSGGRFQVQATWKTPDGASGVAHTVSLADDSGYLWFFSASNAEAIVKVLNGCSLSNHYWVFAGGLTNVQTMVTVTDSQTGFTRTYTNPQGTAFAPIQDTSAFATCP
jgi:Trypsin